LVIDYRLAPQHAFPAPLVDTFVAYLSLLYPPPGSIHSAVLSSNVVLVGDSIGGATCLSFLQTLLTLNRVKHPSLHFQGTSVMSPIPLPAALAGISVNGDVTLSLPDWTRNAPFDMFVSKFGGKRMAALEPEFPPCEAWPTKPPRGYIFCDVSMIYHPLVSVTVTRDWTGAPPLYLASGQEQLRDTVQIVAQKAVSQGVKVVWESYEGMVHTWFALFPKLPHSEKLFKTWANFCRRAVAGESFETIATELNVRTLKPTSIDISTMSDVSLDNALGRMIAKSKTMEDYTGKGATKSNL
jgi:acetyl esterase/lipase